MTEIKNTRIDEGVCLEEYISMKKVAIITLTRNANYGNVLQNFALQSVIESLGLTAETVINLTNSTLFGIQKKNLKNTIKWLINYDNERNKCRKSSVFRKFCRNNINYSSIIYQDGHFTKGEMDIADYDYFMVGSDQVWNPTFGFASDFEFLTFVPHDKRLSYSTSFGISDFSQLSEDVRKGIIDNINNMNVVSVREKSGKAFIDRHCNAKCYVHIDPTLLLTQERWGEFSRKPKGAIQSSYILVYMLGNISAEYADAIEKLAEESESQIINIMQKKWCSIDPAEFVWLVENAKCICTDSFHASVFSILFHKRFYIFNRIDYHARQETRFESLCDTVGIPINQVMVNSKKNDLGKAQIDWNRVDENLATEREKSYDYLNRILSN